MERRWARWQEVGGWHVASGLPKVAELAVAAGSAFLIHTERTVATADLQRLARRGVGLRRPEGFGDLAGPPCLRDGRKARLAREQQARKLRSAVAPLFGAPVRFPDRWPEMRRLLAGHAVLDLGPDGVHLPGTSVAGALREMITGRWPDRADELFGHLLNSGTSDVDVDAGSAFTVFLRLDGAGVAEDVRHGTLRERAQAGPGVAGAGPAAGRWCPGRA